MADESTSIAVVSDGHVPINRPSSKISSVFLFGLIVVLLAFAGIGGWAATAPMASAVPAAAILAVKGERKQVQHYEGGIVDKVLVEEGETVREGQLLVLLNDIQVSATASRLRNQIDLHVAQKARLIAERDSLSSIVFPEELASRVNEASVKEIMESERQQFAARRESLNGQINILKQRISQLEDQIEGHRIQRKSRFDQLKIFDLELVGLRELYRKGHYPRNEILARERAMARLKGEAGSDDAQIARAQNGVGEAKSQIISLRQRFREDVVARYQDIQAAASDLRQRLAVAEDVLARIEVKAPQSGIVQNLKVHTSGGVVRAGQLLMEIAPQDKELIVEAQVSPNDIDNIQVGQEAEVRLVALNMLLTPSVMAKVISVSGDRLVDAVTGVGYFLIRAEISETETEKLGDVTLSAGMPADVLIKTGERTALAYLLKPLTDSLARGMNEK
ncbi:MAG: secretion protein HlyD [Alphaproteobacteria bacterium]|jgi:HlyD family type I secretion membrane fusion protein|nr:secretion protein HlyD [Alphaproteobacteria bacterium]PPR13741.1 MAG: Type I secretion system membrane fusion protein PrsE [Alphaproteobacteria bacterium MarineAlpha12_Bin1]|tara:strand:- start:1128 stop:2474 length:1347 start_codon:yes stop_codon:yes gene_type:complete